MKCDRCDADAVEVVGNVGFCSKCWDDTGFKHANEAQLKGGEMKIKCPICKSEIESEYEGNHPQDDVLVHFFRIHESQFHNLLVMYAGLLEKIHEKIDEIESELPKCSQEYYDEDDMIKLGVQDALKSLLETEK